MYTLYTLAVHPSDSCNLLRKFTKTQEVFFYAKHYDTQPRGATGKALSHLYWHCGINFLAMGGRGQAPQGHTLAPGLNLPAPAGYVEVDEAICPDFFQALAAEFAGDTVLLQRVYVPVAQAGYMAAKEYERLTENLLVAVEAVEPGREGDTAASEELEVASFDADNPELPAIVEAWIKEAAESNTAAMLDLGGFDVRAPYSAWLYLSPVELANTWGVAVNAPLVQASACCEQDGYIIYLAFTRVLSDYKDAVELAAFVKAYLENPPAFTLNANTLRKFEPVEGVPAGFWSLSAESFFERGFAGKAVALYEKALSLPDNDDAYLQRQKWIFAYNYARICASLKDLKRSELLLSRYLEDISAAHGPQGELTLRYKYALASVILNQSRYDEARAILAEIMPAWMDAHGKHSAKSAGFHYTFLSALANSSNFPDAFFFELFPAAFQNITEFGSLGEQGNAVLLVSYAAVLAGKKRETAFWAKVWAGFDSFAVQQEGAARGNTGPSGRNPHGIIAEMQKEFKVPLDAAKVKVLLAAPNSQGQSPCNKAQSLMRGAEIELYKQYGEVAVALQSASQSGDEAAVRAARRDFQAWLKRVGDILQD